MVIQTKGREVETHLSPNNFKEENKMKEIINLLNKWYGNSWWKGGLTLLTVFLVAIILPGLVG